MVFVVNYYYFFKKKVVKIRVRIIHGRALYTGKYGNAKKEQLQFEEEIQKIKLQLKADQLSHMKSQTKEASQGLFSCGVRAKLPKLVITKFDGSHMDWPRFWGQFSENIDKTSVAPITKFTYLRELFTPKVSRTIEALCFTAEGYNHAESILKEEFGKDLEIIKAYMKEIFELPVMTGTNPKAISDFSEKLTYCVQALQTLNKLEQVNGVTLMTLDKLPGIRGDLVRRLTQRGRPFVDKKKSYRHEIK